MAIISLTSIPPRFHGLPAVLETLCRQSPEIAEIRLYLPRRYRRFPDHGIALPALPRAVRVMPLDEDLGPASKVLGAARDLAGSDVPILFCDDDRLYPPGWAAGLLRAHRARPDCAISTIGRHLDQIVPDAPAAPRRPRAWIGKTYPDPAYRLARLRQQWREGRLRAASVKPPRRLTFRAGYADILLGYGGALIRPGFLDAEAWTIPEGLWMVDDIWLSGHLARRGIPIWVPARLPLCQPAQTEPIAPLLRSRIGGMDRDTANRRAVDWFRTHHGIWR